MAENQTIIQSHHNQISVLCDLVLSHALTIGFDQPQAYACSLAVAEVCENIIRHGYGSESDQNIMMTLTDHDEGGLIIQLRDNAPSFNASLKPEQLPWVKEDPPVGGLGLHIIHRVMDQVCYRREDEQNILDLTKYLNKDD